MNPIPEILRVGRCPTCDTLTPMRFLGVQVGWREIPARTLWLCGACETSVTGNWLLPEAVEALFVARYGEEGEDDVDLAGVGGVVSAGAGDRGEFGRAGDGLAGGRERG